MRQMVVVGIMEVRLYMNSFHVCKRPAYGAAPLASTSLSITISSQSQTLFKV